MRTIKIKLAFEPEIIPIARKVKLENWAKAILKKDKLEIVEEKHYEKLSWIVVENAKDNQINYLIKS